MLSSNMLLRFIDDAQKKLGIDYIELAKRSGIPVERYRDLRRGRGKISLDELPRLAKAVGLAFEVVAPHHEPFMQLTEEEAASLLKLAEHYKKNGPQQQHALRSAVEKLTGEVVG